MFFCHLFTSFLQLHIHLSTRVSRGVEFGPITSPLYGITPAKGHPLVVKISCVEHVKYTSILLICSAICITQSPLQDFVAWVVFAIIKFNEGNGTLLIYHLAVFICHVKSRLWIHFKTSLGKPDIFKFVVLSNE